jgi:DNA polymerase/3'-5' exonuclease PolX
MSKFDINNKIIEQFNLLKKQIEYDIDFLGLDVRKNKYRLDSTNKVLHRLKKYDKEIKTAEQLKKEKIKDIGEGTLRRIDEILKTGKLSEIKIPKDAEKYLEFIENLQNIHGIGRKTAYNLFKDYGITSVDDLRKAVKEEKIVLSPTIMKGLKYVDLIKTNIPREDIEYLDIVLRKITIEISPKLVGVVCGSYRRGKLTSGDIDYILVHTDLITKKQVERHNYLEDFLEKLRKKKIIVEDLTELGDTKYMGIAQVKGVMRRIDIRYFALESYYSAILYFTGSKDFNTKMRQVANLNGWTLNEYGLFDEKNRRMEVNSEKDIFDYLEMEYLPPEKR